MLDFWWILGAGLGSQGEADFTLGESPGLAFKNMQEQNRGFGREVIFWISREPAPLKELTSSQLFIQPEFLSDLRPEGGDPLGTPEPEKALRFEPHAKRARGTVAYIHICIHICKNVHVHAAELRQTHAAELRQTHADMVLTYLFLAKSDAMFQPYLFHALRLQMFSYPTCFCLLPMPL